MPRGKRLITPLYADDSRVTLFRGDRLQLLRQLPERSARLIVTSPPYNLGKSYEKRSTLEEYEQEQRLTIEACARVLADDGSLCYQLGNHVRGSELVPLDSLLYPVFLESGFRLRNRIVWRFGHGLNASRRFSCRHETVLWYTKSDAYVFNLDPVRVPQRYPGKVAYKGPRKGQYSSNPLGKNPGDVWDIPNVKANHPEKTLHPCQFPVELVERLVLSMTNEGDLVVDPYAGVGTTAIAALLHNRRAAISERDAVYVGIARQRLELAASGRLPTRPMGRPIHEPQGKLARNPFAAAAKGAEDSMERRFTRA